jgi:predicted RNA-binding protein YlxR (DUF448 family)
MGRAMAMETVELTSKGQKNSPERHGPERRCIATGVSMPIDGLLRFVVGPEGNIYPDLGRDLPGRGIWISGRRELLEQAVKKRLFARAAKSAVTVAADLPDQIEAALVRRSLALLGLARRAGQLALGYEKVRSLLADDPRAMVVSACDSSEKGREKLLSGLRGPRGQSNENDQSDGDTASAGRKIVNLFRVDELSLALGRENVVHAALRAGGLADRFLIECRRLEEFRS